MCNVVQCALHEDEEAPVPNGSLLCLRAAWSLKGQWQVEASSSLPALRISGAVARLPPCAKSQAPLENSLCRIATVDSLARTDLSELEIDYYCHELGESERQR